jgi:hypothetical protein
MKIMKKKYRSYDQRRLKILSDRVCDDIESLLQYFHIESKTYSKMISMSCPIHGGDNNAALNLYPEGDKYRGNWKCRTHHCEEIFKGSIIGFIRGVLSHNEHGWSKDGDEMVSFDAALAFAEEFVDQKLDEIKIDKKLIEKTNFVNTIGYINTSTKPSNVLINRSKIQKSLSIPSKYFIERGYSENILKRYDVGDCSSANKEMSDRAVVPVYDMNYNYMVGCTGRSTFNKCDCCSSFHNALTACPSKQESWLMSKWRHSKDFKTQEHLYNYWFAKDHILKTHCAILVESPGNVWRLEEAGIHNSLALFGSSLSDKQKILLDMSGALTLVLIMDNDDAGKKAADIIRKKCSKTYNIYNIDIEASDIGEMTIDQVKQHITPRLENIYHD